MASGLSNALNISISSLLFNQTAMSTISHNLANVNNEDFSRQEINADAQFIAGFGSGVEVGAITRRVDEQIQSQLTVQVANRSFAETTKRFMENVEIIFGTPNSTTRINNVLSDIFGQLNNVANLPESSAQKLNAINQILFMTDQLNGMNSGMRDLQRDIDGEVDNQISVVNRAIARIHELNTEIAISGNTSTSGGQNTNDLEDVRQEQIRFLSEALKINTIYDEDNRAIINSENGQQFIGSGGFSQLERTASAGLFPDIGIRSISADGILSTFVLPLNTTNLTGGSLKALVDVRDVDIENMLSQLDEFSRVTIEEFNAVHSRGIGIPPPSSIISRALTTPAVDLFAEIGLVPGSSFDVSIVDPTTGAPLNTTTVTLPALPPLSGVGLAAIINGTLIGAGFPATTVATFAAGRLDITDSTNTVGIVMGNDTDDFLGRIVMNPLLEGTDSATITVRPDIQTQPGLLATAQMRAADGGLSLNNNINAIALTQVGTTNFNFNAAGSLTPQFDTLSGYFSTITANLAVELQDNTRRLDFASRLETDLSTRNSAVSGVNTDEELANLIIFQNSFQASARVISTIDEMFDTLMNII